MIKGNTAANSLKSRHFVEYIPESPAIVVADLLPYFLCLYIAGFKTLSTISHKGISGRIFKTALQVSAA
jgi:hypothetical protein